jgi:hypothetical protein
LGNVVSVELVILKNSTGNTQFSGSAAFDTGEKGALAYRRVFEEIRDHAARATIAGEIDARDAARGISDE